MSGAHQHRRRSSRKSRNVRRSRRIVLTWCGVALALVIGCAAWVGVRLFLSYSELHQAQADAKSTIAAVAADPAGAATSAGSDLDALSQRLASARDLTGDPVWRAAEVLPFAGANLRAYRLTVEGLSSAVGTGLKPALPALGQLSEAVSLTDGSVDVGAVSAGAGKLERAAAALEESRKTLADADGGGIVQPLADGVEQATTMVDELSETVSSLSVAAHVLPAALGADGEKHYGLLFNNNAELRTSGGIAGAISELSATNGSIALGGQYTPTDLNQPGNGFPTSSEERMLFGTRLGSYVQNVNLTPDFVRSGQLTSEYWQRANGRPLDGVVAIDAVTIGRLLAVTGPVTVQGQQITADNATKALLSDVYWRLPNPADQDAFFAEVTRAMFDKVLHGGAPVLGVLKALDGAATEGRISVWFADGSLQNAIATSSLAGPLAQLRDGSPIGVFLADGTAAKMDYYLAGSIAGGSCQSRQGRNLTASVTLHSTAPADIASAPWYVTGAGMSDVPVGTIRTMVQFAGAKDTRLKSIQVDGTSIPLTAGMIDGHPVGIAFVDLPPGGASTLKATFTALPGKAPTFDRVVATPTSTPFEHSIERDRCG